MTSQDFRRLALAHELLPCYAPHPETTRAQINQAATESGLPTGCEAGMAGVGRALVEPGPGIPT